MFARASASSAASANAVAPAAAVLLLLLPCCRLILLWLPLLLLLPLLPLLPLLLHYCWSWSVFFSLANSLAKSIMDSQMCCCCCAPTKEYTYPSSMIHPRLTTAGIEIAPHYHQLLILPTRYVGNSITPAPPLLLSLLSKLISAHRCRQALAVCPRPGRRES